MSLRTSTSRITTRLTAPFALLAMLAAGCASEEAEPPAEEAGEQQPGVVGTPVAAALADVPVPTAADVVNEVLDPDFRAFYEMGEVELLIAVSPTDEDDTALNLQLTEA